ncbi:uncharacterized protein LOC107269906 [Cephus cinctus]|uniref:Uncharacterized protein LOC107269906 n=1 Tax=Cephus cinctus TaxID=211228 RepID=A0AAJ7FMY9_CEPCN|nr:uncharacterized protein LOC107269906 [Cephus cinctus]
MTNPMEVLNDDIYRVFRCGSAILFARFVIIYFRKIRNFAVQYIFEVPEGVQFSSHSNVAYTDGNNGLIKQSEDDFQYVVLWTLCTWFWLTTSPPYWLAATLIRIFVITETIGEVLCYPQ